MKKDGRGQSRLHSRVTITATHEVRSNRESGLGRYDVALLPRAPGTPGVIMDLQVPRQKETPAGALENAARQIVERQYATELRARGADPVYGYAVVFDRKQVAGQDRPPPVAVFVACALALHTALTSRGGSDETSGALGLGGGRVRTGGWVDGHGR